MNGILQLKPGLTAGDIQATIFDSGGLETSVIKLGDAWHVDLAWQITGTVDLNDQFGNWVVKAYLERFGPGPDLILGTFTPASPVAFTGGTLVGPNTLRYTVQIEPSPAVVDEGVYLLAVSVRFHEPNSPTGLAGFVQGPMIEFTPS